MKISSLQDSIFSATYSKKFTDDNSNLETSINNWIIHDAEFSEGVSKTLGNIGVDNSWFDYFVSPAQKIQVNLNMKQSGEPPSENMGKLLYTQILADVNLRTNP